MSLKEAREHSIGPFEYSEAVDCIKKFALALTNLGLNDRFTISATPRPVRSFEKRSDKKKARVHTTFQVVLVDKRPDEPKPEGLTALKIAAARAKGYTKPRVTYYEAFGQRMNLTQWAKAAGVSPPTLKTRIDAGMTMEEAITQIALKKTK